MKRIGAVIVVSVLLVAGIGVQVSAQQEQQQDEKQTKPEKQAKPDRNSGLPVPASGPGAAVRVAPTL